MGIRAAFVVSMAILLSIQPVVSSLDTGTSHVRAPPQSTGEIVVIDHDWILDFEDSYTNATIYLTGNLTITSSGRLELINSSLVLNLSQDGEYWVQIYGRLKMNDLDNDPMTLDDMSIIRSNVSSYNYHIDAKAGSWLQLSNSQIRDHGFSSANKGLVVNSNVVTIQGMRFQNGYYGISIINDGITILDSWFLDNRYGVEIYRSDSTLDNCTISGSQSRGIYPYNSQVTISNCNVNNNYIGIYEYYSDLAVSGSSITNSAIAGVESYSSSSLYKDSVLANNMDIKLVRESFPRMLNTSFNHSRVDVGHGLFASVGRYVDVLVEDANGTAMANHSVAVMDQEGTPASSGTTNGAGWAAMYFTERLLTEYGPIQMAQHRIVALEYDGVNISFGSNVTALSPGQDAQVVVQQNPEGILAWDNGKTIDSVESYDGQEIFALGQFSLGPGGSLELNNTAMWLMGTEGNPMMSPVSGHFISTNSSIGSMATAGPLLPVSFQMVLDEYADAEIRGTTLTWCTELSIASDNVDISNASVLHSEKAGVSISSSAPHINGLYVNWTPKGAYIYNGQPELENITMENAREYGVQCAYSDFKITGLEVTGAPKAIYSYDSASHVVGLMAQGGDYGIYAYNSEFEVHDSSIREANFYGAYWLNSESRIYDTEVHDCPTGMFSTEADIVLESCNLSGNGVGLEAKNCGPVVLNTSFSNDVDLRADRTGKIAAVNCTLNQTRVEVEPSGQVELGAWTHVSVRDESGKAARDCNVTILDSEDNVASSSKTDSDGNAYFMAFRQKTIYWNRTVEHSAHSVLAFLHAVGYQGMNRTSLSPGSTVFVNVSVGGMGWIHLYDYTVLNTPEVYENKTLIVHDNVIIDSGGSLTLDNCNLWFFGGKKTYQYIHVKIGFLNMQNTTVRPISMSAPLHPYLSQIFYDRYSTGIITDSHISGLKQLSSFSDDFLVSGTIIEGADGAGIYLEGGGQRLEDCIIRNNAEGLWSINNQVEMDNVLVVESGQYGIYAEGGHVFLNHTSSLLAKDGFYLYNGVGGELNECNASDNEIGVFIYESPAGVDGLKAVNNSNCGIRVSGSHSSMTSLELTDNYYGIYSYDSWPDISNSRISGNTYGLYLYNSGPFLNDCNISDNTVGIYEYGADKTFNKDVLESGLKEDSTVFLRGGEDEHMALELPARAEVVNANISITGTVVGVGEVTQDSETQRSPDIHENIVVWQDYRDGNWEIYAYDLALDSDGDDKPNYLETPHMEEDPALLRITENNETQGEPAIHNDTVVWSDFRNGEYDIYAYSFSNGTVWPVCTDPSTQKNPAVYEDQVVWQDYRNGHYDIYHKNLTSGKISRLSTSTRHDMGPSIHGNHVVWYSYMGSPDSGETSDIVMFDLEKWALIDITSDKPIQYEPDVYGDIIVWHDNRNGNWEIFKYDISTGNETQLTKQVQQSFCPRIYGNDVVYYYHHRVEGFWSVHLVNTSTLVNTVLERETFGDSRPVIHGKRVAWVNRTNNDIHVLDMSLTGRPSNVTVDFGSDGVPEFHCPGELNGTEYINESVLTDSLNLYLKRISNQTTMIPINIMADGTGRVIVHINAIEFFMPTFVLETNITGSASRSVMCYYYGPTFINSSIAGALDFDLRYDSDAVVLNSTFNSSRLSFSDKESSLTVKNYLHVRVENLTGAPLNATVTVTDNNQTIFKASTGPGGETRWMPVTHGIHNSTGFHLNDTWANAKREKNIFTQNPRQLDMSLSCWEIFTTDSVGPVASNAFPPPFWTSADLGPEISVHITDTLGLNSSTIRLYVEGYSVFFGSTAVPDGYNISYQHPADFEEGAIINCRLYGEDIHGNFVDYSWEFKIDSRAVSVSIELQAGWNLVSIPFDTYDQSAEAVLSGIDGKYDVVKAYTRAYGEGRWLSYRVGMPDAVNDHFTIDRGIGIWVHALENCTLEVSGIMANETNIPLYAGWNLVGYPTLNDTMTVADALWGTGADRVEVFDPETPYVREAEATYVMKPGEGYWVHVPADSMWTVDW